MKKDLKSFFRAFLISLIIVGNLILLVLGITKAYIETRAYGYGDYTAPIKKEKDRIKIFDFYIE